MSTLSPPMLWAARCRHLKHSRFVMLSQKAKYALRALLELAQAGPGEALLISDIAERQRLPKKFLEQILLELKRRGIVRSKRGKNGGYALLKPPSVISFGEIVRIVDGPLAPLPCLSRTAYRRCDDCVDEARCAIRRVFAVTHAATAKVLDETSLVDAIQGSTLRSAARTRQHPARPSSRR